MVVAYQLSLMLNWHTTNILCTCMIRLMSERPSRPQTIQASRTVGLTQTGKKVQLLHRSMYTTKNKNTTEMFL